MSNVASMLIWIIVGIVLLVMIALLVAEGRVMRKPESEWSDGERRFLRADRAVGRAHQSYARSVAPWLVVGMAVVGLLVTIPFWSEGRTGAAIGLTAFFVVFGVGAVLLWALVLRKRGRGSDWRADQDRQQREADAAGRPRWFVSVRAGWWLGGVGTGLGLVLLVFAIATGGDVVGGTVVTAIGVLFLVMVMIQQRAEAKR